MSRTESVQERLAWLEAEIRSAAKAAGRDPAGITTVLVTKTVSEERILEAAQAGIRDFGENRVQELLAKKKNLPAHLRWHMIGHLQTNKARQVVGEAALLQSLDRPELLRELEIQGQKKQVPRIPCLVQVNTSGEASKFGLAPNEVEAFVRGISPNSGIELQGVMTIGPWTDREDRIRKVFRETRILWESLKTGFPHHPWETLSMGMSGDFRIAIEEGATMLRIGTAVFGARK